MGMGYAGNPFDIHHIGIRIPQCLQENSLRIFTDCTFQFFFVKGINKSSYHPEIRKGMCQKIICAAIYVPGRHNMISLMGQILKGIGNRRRSRCHRQGSASSLQSRHPPFKYIFRRIGQSTVYITACGKGKSVGSILAVMKYIGRCLIYGNSPGIRSRIRLFLPHMKL